MGSCYKYTVSIHYRAGSGSEREKRIIECAKEYACEIGPHLIDRLLEERYKLFQAHKLELARIAGEEAKLAEEKRRALGG